MSLVKRGRAIPEPTPDKLDRRPVYRVDGVWGDDEYATKQFYWNCAVCGKEFVARRDAKHCALFHCPKCETGSLVFDLELFNKTGNREWFCECGHRTTHNPEFIRETTA